MAGLKRAFVRDHLDLDPLVRADHRGREAGAQLGQIGADVDMVDAVGGMEMALHGRDRHHPLVRVAKLVASLLRRHRPGLQQEDAGDDLEAVGDSMLHLAQQGLVLGEQLLGMLEQGLLLALDQPAFGDVLEGEQERRAGAVLIAHQPGAEQHRSAAQLRAILLELEPVHRRVIAKHGLELPAKRRDVPLALGRARRMSGHAPFPGLR